jgi:hypothetical protein
LFARVTETVDSVPSITKTPSPGDADGTFGTGTVVLVVEVELDVVDVDEFLRLDGFVVVVVPEDFGIVATDAWP